MPKYRILIARFPGNLVDHPAGTDWLIGTVCQMKTDPQIGDILRWRKSDTPITMSRNAAVKHALEQDADYLLMLDNDIGPDDWLGADPAAKPFWDSTWSFLLQHRDTPCAVAAPYVGPPPHENIYVFQWANHQSDCPDSNWKLEQFTREEAGGRGGIEEVAALPTGLIVYDVRALRSLPPVKDKGWFYYEWTDATCSEKASTEDVVQTRDMSMAWYGSGGVVGGRVYCNWDAWAYHDKRKCCRKPQRITVAEVAEGYKEAILSNRRRGEQLVILGGKGPRSARPALNGQAAPAPEPTRVDQLIQAHESPAQARGVAQALLLALQNGAEGDVVEFGCKDGQASVLMQALLEDHQAGKTLYLYDSFEGLPALGEHDRGAAHFLLKGFLKAHPDQVRNRFARLQLPAPVIHAGWFKDLTAAQLPQQIAFAYLDGDLYDSIWESLHWVYPRLTAGATCLIDDYDDLRFPGCTLAVRDFLMDKPESAARWGRQAFLVKESVAVPAGCRDRAAGA